VAVSIAVLSGLVAEATDAEAVVNEEEAEMKDVFLLFNEFNFTLKFKSLLAATAASSRRLGKSSVVEEDKENSVEEVDGGFTGSDATHREET
jgi:hypothetical protein